LAPKIYGLKNTAAPQQLEEIIKIKGLTKAAINNNNINLKLLKTLLTKDYHLIFNQRKWFRNLKDANIKILDQIYTLKVTQNKRELIFKDNLLVGTKPFKLNNSGITNTLL